MAVDRPIEARGRAMLDALVQQAAGAKVLADAGIVRPVRPDKLFGVINTLKRWGRGPASGYITSGLLCPDATAVIDERGSLSFGELDRRTNALANSLAAAGIREGDGVGIMCRNHRGFVEATVATAKLGADVLYLNTAFAGPQLAEVVERERPAALIYDEEFSGLLQEAGDDRPRFVAWHDGDDRDEPTLDELIAAGSDLLPPIPGRVGRTVILTSGTTGSPKGASRSSPQSLGPAISLLSKIPLRRGQTTHIAAPLFHSWGFAHFTMGLMLNATLVLHRRFDPEASLAAIARTRADSLVVVPVMMQRILDLPAETRRRYDTSSLSIVAASGSALPGDLATEWMDEYGDTLYNLYGSTEVAWATIASPREMRAAPGTAGTPPRGTVVRLFDEQGSPVPQGQTGRIFVGNEFLFEGYTGGGTKDEIDGLMATGDVGRFDAAGRLFVEGRDDEMIVSGGENVFPKEVEDLLARHGAVAEAAAIGVPDAEFGQRLLAFVVRQPGADVGEGELQAYVKENLARYKAPREVRFLDELPRNATGKVLKRELRETVSEG
ncbi:MAG TPA: AMP-binding protein [Thermoleophilaceae bacterium]|nr:AMP-binding protein [Thermoleophilaceae bacterium]